jgi:hypothetical protein
MNRRDEPRLELALEWRTARQMRGRREEQSSRTNQRSRRTPGADLNFCANRLAHQAFAFTPCLEGSR